MHRFALGGGPFERHSEWFLCPFEVDDGENDGVPASEVRLDETLGDSGDTLAYLYDYGDSWELTIRLEEVLPTVDGPPIAVCVDGDRAAPPEDCGGLADAEDLAAVLDDPAHFDVDEVNAALADPYFVLRDRGVVPGLVELLYRLSPTDNGAGLITSLIGVLDEKSPEPTQSEKADALRAYQWFLDRADGDGIPLTAAGYLKPVDVVAASEIVPRVADWIGEKNREAHTYPLLAFRESLQALGLLRKYKGRLLVTRAGKKVSGDPEALWVYLATRLMNAKKDRFVEEASLLVVAFAVISSDGSIPIDRIAEALGYLGWATTDGGPVGSGHIYHLDPSPLDVLWNVGDPPEREFLSRRLSPEALALARTAVLTDPGWST
ncbi:MAG: plasmid pRiA4b ORF-3 family protein [Actinomycetota bacterium]